MKEFAKAVARGLATVAVGPIFLSFFIRRGLVGRDRALESSCETLSLIPGFVGQYMRRAFLARTLDYCGPNTVIGFGALFSQAGARIDDYVYIGPRCHLGLVHIEKDVLLAAGVHIPSGAHIHGTDDPDVPIRNQPGTPTRVRIGAGAWIGSSAVVLADVGAGTIVGAGAVVTQPLPDRVVAGGVPARVLKSRTAPTDARSGRSRA